MSGNGGILSLGSVVCTTYVKYVLLPATAGPAYIPMFDYCRAACFGIRSHTFIKAWAKKSNNLDAGK
jgi:hypothetical protein